MAYTNRPAATVTTLMYQKICSQSVANVEADGGSHGS